MRKNSSLIKRLLAALVALMLIFSAVAFMEDEDGEEAAEEPVKVEEVKEEEEVVEPPEEEPTIAPTEEPTEEPVPEDTEATATEEPSTEEPTAVPAEDEPTLEPDATEAPSEEPTEEPTPEVSESPTPEATATPEPMQDGLYKEGEEKAILASDELKITDYEVTVKSEVASVKIITSSTAYDKLFLGTAEDAKKADEDVRAKGKKRRDLSDVELESNKLTYELSPIEFDAVMPVAMHMVADDSWKDASLLIYASKLVRTGDVPTPTPEPTETPTPEATEEVTPEPTEEPTPEPTETPTPTPTATAAPTPTATPALDGKTTAVDSSTTLADGVYSPSSFTFSGGSGRASISCSKVQVEDGHAYAWLVFDSANYGYVKAHGKKYLGNHTSSTSTFKIPVALGKNNRILGMTTAMSTPMEIEYIIYVNVKTSSSGGSRGGSSYGRYSGSGSSRSSGDDEDEERSAHLTEDEIEELDPWTEEDAEIEGLTFIERDDLGESLLVNVYHYEDGFIGLDVRDEGILLLIPEDSVADLPLSVYDHVSAVIQLPITSSYIASDDAMQLIDEADLLPIVDKITAVHDPIDAMPWEILTDKAEAQEIVSAGDAIEPDYTALMETQCQLAVLPFEFAELKLPEDELALIDPMEIEKMTDVTERLSMLGIPMLVDRSFEEESEAGRLGWLKIYGVLYGCEEQANEAYQTAIDLLNAAEAEAEALEDGDEDDGPAHFGRPSNPSSRSSSSSSSDNTL